MVSKLTYVDQAIRILLEGRRKQWDPTIVSTFVDMIVDHVDEKSAEALPNPQSVSVPSQAILMSS